jgi:hypothetical protein
MNNKRTHDAGSETGVPRIYDEVQDDRSTVAIDPLNPLAKLSNGKALPRIIRKPRPTEPLDPRGARLLGFVDGRTPLGIIFQSAGMDEGEAVAVLAQLLDLGIIDVR